MIWVAHGPVVLALAIAAATNGVEAAVRRVIATTLALSACAHGERAAVVDEDTSDRGLEVATVMCDGAEVPWTPRAYQDMGRLLSYGLDLGFMYDVSEDGVGVDLNDLGLRGYDGEIAVVIHPKELAVTIDPARVRLPDVPDPPPPDTEYWILDVGERFTDGALIVREQRSILREPGFGFAIAVVCAGYVGGKPTFVSLGGFAS